MRRGYKSARDCDPTETFEELYGQDQDVQVGNLGDSNGVGARPGSVENSFCAGHDLSEGPGTVHCSGLMNGYFVEAFWKASPRYAER